MFFLQDEIFYCEIAIMEFETGQIMVFYCYNDDSANFHQLPHYIQNRIKHQSKIHRMYYRNKECDDVEYCMIDVKHRLFNTFIDFQQKQGHVLVAYKGRSVEQALLNELEFKGVNIEFLECPKIRSSSIEIS